MTDSLVPPIPERLDGGRSEGTLVLRYDDVLQDGRLALVPLAHALGAAAWPAVLSRPEAQRASAAGIVPILIRLGIVAEDVEIPATRPLRCEAAWHRWTARSPDGSVDRLVLSMWVTAFGRSGSTFGPPLGGPEVQIGRVYAEHVFTRLFAGPGDRRVISLPDGVPEATGRCKPLSEVAPEPPDAGAQEGPERTFGLMHTDSNRHVNSLVYLRRFEEEVVADGPLRPARRCEIAWRKPFFAGDTVRIRRWRAADGGRSGAFADAEGLVRCRIALD